MTTTRLDAVEARAAAAGGAGKRAYVRRMFSEIAPRYDLLNRLLSLNIDRGWRRAAIAWLNWSREPAGVYLDLCAGTMDVGAALATERGFAGLVLGADFAEPMLRRGLGKAPDTSLRPVTADALQLPLPDESLAGVIVSFGVRNLADLDAGLREVHRVLRPGGRFVVLEFSTPRSALIRTAFRAYSRLALPIVGRLVSGHATAYTYLPESVANFPEADALAERMRLAGFADVRFMLKTFGVVAIHAGEKLEPGRAAVA